jgi:hypothetical protein
MVASQGAGRARRRPDAASPVDIAIDGGVTTITVRGELDAAAAAHMVGAVRAAVQSGTGRLDIDLRAIDSYTSDGAAALGACRELGAGLADGLHYLTSQGAAMAALLEGCATESAG